MVLAELRARAWQIGTIVLAVVALVGWGYVGWLRLVTVPALRADVSTAQAGEKEAKANVSICTSANESLQASVDRQNEAINQLRKLAAANNEELRKTLVALGLIGKDTKVQLSGYKPDPSKSDCDNARAQLQMFKIERGQ